MDNLDQHLLANLFLILSSQWYAKRRRGFAEHHIGQSRHFSENAHTVTIEPHGIFNQILHTNTF